MTNFPEIVEPAILVAILIGMVQCFFGYRLFKVAVAIIGFSLGAALAMAIISAISIEKIAVLLSGLLGGITGAVMVLTLYYVGIFAMGAALGGIAGSFAGSAAGLSSAMWLIIAAAVIAGILALIFQKYMVILATSFGGSWLMVMALGCFATGAKHVDDIESILQARGSLLYILLLGWLLIGVCGWVVQLQSLRKRVPAPEA
jgi:hypothetical protein